MTYHLAGLGQSDSGTITAATGSSGGVARLQAKLIEYGMLSMRAPDGRISSANSATVRAVRSYATRSGLSASGISRTSSGGLTLPRALHDAILAGPPAGAPGAPAAEEGDASDPGEPGARSSRTPSWLPWAVLGGVGVVGVLTGAAVIVRWRS